MDKIAESIKALAAAIRTAADAYARYVDTYCNEDETYREKYENEAQIRKMAMEAMGDAMADKRRRSWLMPKHDYPLHPGQTHAEPYYCTIPLEEYEALKNRVRQLEHVCKINGIVVPGISDYTMSQPPFKEDA